MPRQLDTRRFLHSDPARGALTGAPRHVIPARSPAGSGSLQVRSIEYLLANASDHGAGDAQSLQYVPTGQVYELSSGLRVLHLQQEFLGLPVFEAMRSVRFDKDGNVLAVTGDTVPIPGDTETVPKFDAASAVLAACLYVGQQDSGAAHPAPFKVSKRRPRRIAAFASPSRPTVLSKRPFRNPLVARLTLFYRGHDLRLAWAVHLRLPEGFGEYEVLVSADRPRDAEILLCRRTAAHAGVVGHVFEFNPGEAIRGPIPFPRPRNDLPRLGGITVANIPSAWVESGGTSGNNAESHRNNDAGVLKGASTGAQLVFQPLDPLGLEQGQLNAFYLCNFLHDFYALLGFDESARNFQRRNFTADGEENDAVVIRVFGGELEGLASMRSRLDGTPPELKLGRLGQRHSSLDADIVVHEFTHGVTNRLIGGPDSAEPLAGKEQSEAMAEGYSDYFALSILNYYRRRAGLPEGAVFGAWISGGAATGRRAHAYDDAFPGRYSSLGKNGFRDSHDAGQVWGATLLRMNRTLARVGTREAGDELGWQLVMDSLKLVTPAADRPHFLDGRQAIFDAFDDKVTAGQIPGNTAELRAAIVQVFTSMGMGPAAQSVSARYDDIHADPAK